MPSDSAITRHRLSSNRTLTSPRRSVRNTRTPAVCSRRSVDAVGCPNRLDPPTLMRAISGRIACSVSADTESVLPWCPTFRTVTRGRLPRVRRDSRTSASASPVSSALNPPCRTRRTTHASLAAGSDTAVLGDMTWTVNLPTRHESPATTSFSGARSRLASSDKDARAPFAARMPPTLKPVASALAPPMWSA